MFSLTSPVETPFHRLPADAKLLALALFTVGVFFITSPYWQACALAFVGGLHLVAGRRVLIQAWVMLRPLWVFVVLILIWHLVTQDMAAGVTICIRLVSAVALANLVTMTTPLQDMIDIALSLLRPFRALGLNTGAIGLAIALVIRFTPALRQNAAHLSQAWRARSARRPGWRLAVPLTLIAVDDAEHVAEALRARGGAPQD